MVQPAISKKSSKVGPVEAGPLEDQKMKKTNTSDMLVKRKQNASVLAAGYTWQKRMLEYGSIIGFSVGFGINAYRVWQLLSWSNAWMIVTASVLSMAFSDIFSGLLHWAADTWGNMETPVVKSFIRSFREHHVDPFGITRHDVVETNGDNCLALLPIVWLLLLVGTPTTDSEMFILVFAMNVAFWTVVSNQIHKWAHMLTPPPVVAGFQSMHIILNRKEHQVHHHTPFDRYYCITTGWLNPLLASFAFWKRMEMFITEITGVKPRLDDAFWTVQLVSD